VPCGRSMKQTGIYSRQPMPWTRRLPRSPPPGTSDAGRRRLRSTRSSQSTSKAGSRIGRSLSIPFLRTSNGSCGHTSPVASFASDLAGHAVRRAGRVKRFRCFLADRQSAVAGRYVLPRHKAANWVGPGACVRRTAQFTPFSPARGPPTDWGELVQVYFRPGDLSGMDRRAARHRHPQPLTGSHATVRMARDKLGVVGEGPRRRAGR